MDPKKILLVDDDPQIHDLYKLRLSGAGFTVLEAWNGKEGIEMAKKEKPDFILLDVLMPVMDGPRALLEIKEDPELKAIPVLILTGLEDRPIDVRVAKEVGAVDFINKSVEFKELLSRIKGTLHIE
jgi:DNA-binding response OmpR family regulator